MLVLLSKDIITRPEIKTVNVKNRDNNSSYEDMENRLSSNFVLWLKMTFEDDTVR